MGLINGYTINEALHSSAVFTQLELNDKSPQTNERYLLYRCKTYTPTNSV